tara:strand:+ start:86 stop:307 length:222 start_codon:yes stop_codon:yes gene_type:complete
MRVESLTARAVVSLRGTTRKNPTRVGMSANLRKGNVMKNKSFLGLLVGAFGSLGFWVAVWILAFILYSTGASQ